MSDTQPTIIKKRLAGILDILTTPQVLAGCSDSDRLISDLTRYIGMDETRYIHKTLPILRLAAKHRIYVRGDNGKSCLSNIKAFIRSYSDANENTHK